MTTIHSHALNSPPHPPRPNHYLQHVMPTNSITASRPGKVIRIPRKTHQEIAKTHKSRHTHTLPPRNLLTQPRKIAETRSNYHSSTNRILLEAGPEPPRTSPNLFTFNIQEDSISREYATHSHSTRRIPRDCQLSF